MVWISVSVANMIRAIQRFPLLFLSLLALISRVYNLNSPIIGVHAWRQSDTAAMARNFYEMPLTLGRLQQFFYPQVDWGGGGYAETEFPIYPAVVSWLYRIGGAHTPYARFVTVLFSLIGLYFLYRLVERCFNRSIAFWSSLFYAILPMSVFYGRTVQPESLVMMSTLGGLYFFKRWTDEEKDRDLVLSWVFSAIAFLTKVLPLIYLGIPLLFLAAVKYRAHIFRRWQLWVYAIALLTVTFAWYYHAHQIYLNTGLTFGFWAGDTDRYSWIDLLSFRYWGDILLRLIVRHFAVFGFIVALIGLSYRRQKTEDYLWEVGLVSSLLANAIAPTSSYIHEYYQLPTMLYGLVFIGKVYSATFSLEPESPPHRKPHRKVSSLWLNITLALTFITGSTIYAIDYMRHENIATSEVYYLAEQIHARIPADAKVIATTGGDPNLLYLAHRKGWLIQPGEVSPERLKTAQEKGADFLVGSYEVIQSYAPFDDEAQKENIRANLAVSQAADCEPLVNDDRIFISPLCP
ncbi:MAG: glycosyltransferase family 39 protein [Cyanobacteria bacterium J06621_11]